MKNLISYLIFDDVSDSYELMSQKPGVDFGDRFVPARKRVRNSLYDEIDKIDLIKRQKIRRLPHPFKDNTQRIC